VRLVLLCLLPLLAGWDLLQSPNRAIEDGNARLKAGKAEEALGHYDRAVKELAIEPGAHFDRGAALFALGRFDEAVQEFLRATEARTPSLKAAAFYNLGNGLFKQEKYGDAIAAYRRALGIDPTDMRAKWNLELALKKKKDKDEQDKKDEEKKDQEKKDDQKEQEKKDQQGKNEDQKDPQNQKDKQDPQSKQEQPKPEEAPKDQPEQKQDEQQQAQKDKDKDQDEDKDKDKKEGESMSPTPPPPSDKTPDMKEIEAVLDSLERSTKDLEKRRAQLRAIRRAPPRKNW
jgi:Ca-activated chloride channel homolog